MVTAHHPLSAHAGVETLQAGGNAIDAAVCAAFVNSVVRPDMNGLGGFGGCMVIYLAETKRVVAVDYSTIAPREARADMYSPIPDAEVAQDSRMGWPFHVLPGYATKRDENITGYLAISVPPQPAGLALALERFGTLPLAEVVQPAIRIARDGFIVDDFTAAFIASDFARLRDYPATRDMLSAGGHMLCAGDRLVMGNLSETLRVLADDGIQSFYEGCLAGQIIDHIREHGGILSLEDLRTYRAQIEEHPSRGTYRGFELFTPSLRAGGGATVLQILNLLEGFDLHRLGAGSTQSAHLMLEAMKVAWRDRFQFMGDPAYMHIPESHFISKTYADQQRARLRRILEIGSHSGEPDAQLGDASHTTHLNVVDEVGNVVSLTQTNGWGFGSLVTVPGLGIVMNNGMSGFDPRPGSVNSIASGKRPISRMCPTIVLKDGRPVIAIGATGGRRIMTVLAQMLVDLIDFGLSAEETVGAPRFHCEAEEPVLLEYGEGMSWGYSEEVMEGLGAMGHHLRFTGDESTPLFQRTATPFLITIDPSTGERRGACRRLPVDNGAVAGY